MDIEGNYVSDYIRVYKDALNKTTLNKILKYAKDKPPFSEIETSKVFKTKTNENNIIDTSRNSKTEHLDSFKTKSMTKVRITNSLIFYLNDYMRKYIESAAFIDGLHLRINQIDLLRYSKDNYFDRHIDDGNFSNRTLSFVLLLNKDYEGGELEFFLPNKEKSFIKIKNAENVLIVFPSNFMYPHYVNPVTKGERYSIVAWAH